MPDPYVIEVAIEAKRKADRDKLASAIEALAAEDPSFGVAIDMESGQIILKGVSEAQLDAKVDSLRRGSPSMWARRGPSTARR